MNVDRTSNQMLNGPCCAHSIVARETVSGSMPGTVTDAWACCDCGARFSHDPSLPTFLPGPSFLHTKLADLQRELAEARDEATQQRADFDKVYAERDALRAALGRYMAAFPHEHALNDMARDAIERCAVNGEQSL